MIAAAVASGIALGATNGVVADDAIGAVASAAGDAVVSATVDTDAVPAGEVVGAADEASAIRDQFRDAFTPGIAWTTPQVVDIRLPGRTS